MNLILLGGNSPVNEPWLQGLAAILESHFASVYVHRYRHWKTEEPLIDLEYELQALAATARKKEGYVILGKSAGALLALKGVRDGTLNPTKCIFVGLPVHWARQNNFNVDKWLQGYSVLTLFIQQSHDPAMSFDDLKHYLEQANVTNYQLEKVSGNDHEYSNFDELSKLISPFLIWRPRSIGNSYSII